MLRSAGASPRRGPAPRGAGGPRRGARRPARGGALVRALAACVMVQGTASSVGKSVIATALCRVLHDEGWRVAPFKAQNMSLNAAVTPAGEEIGRAQAAQAEAAGVTPRAAMNPILLKPEGDGRSQGVVLGRVGGSVAAREYWTTRRALWPSGRGA